MKSNTLKIAVFSKAQAVSVISFLLCNQKDKQGREEEQEREIKTALILGLISSRGSM